MTRQENLTRMIKAAAAISKDLGQQVEKLVSSGEPNREELDRLGGELRRHLGKDTAELVYTVLLYALGLPKEEKRKKKEAGHNVRGSGWPQSRLRNRLPDGRSTLGF